MTSTLVLLRTLGGLCLVLIGLVYLRVKRVERMRKNIALFLQTFADFERRGQIVEAEAATFINSMDTEVTANLYEVRQIIGRAREVAHGIEDLMSLRSYYGISRASRLVNSKILNPDDISGKRLEYAKASWEERLETLIQSVGRKIAKAAQRSSNHGYSGSATPSRTLKRLSDAGILYHDE